MFNSLYRAFSSPNHKQMAVLQLAEAQKNLLQYTDTAEQALHMTHYLQAKVIRLQNLIQEENTK